MKIPSRTRANERRSSRGGDHPRSSSFQKKDIVHRVKARYWRIWGKMRPEKRKVNLTPKTQMACDVVREQGSWLWAGRRVNYYKFPGTI